MMVGGPAAGIATQPVVRIVNGGGGLGVGGVDFPNVLDIRFMPSSRGGEALACLGDIDFDGLSDIAVGLPGFDAPPLIGVGSVGIFLSGYQGGIVDTPSYLIDAPADAVGLGNFGDDLLAADLDGDGVLDLVVGEPGQECGGAMAGSGRAYVFPAAQLVTTDPQAVGSPLCGPAMDAGGTFAGGFFRTLSVPGDLCGDPNPDLLTGVIGHANDTGVLYVWCSNAATFFEAPSVANTVGMTPSLTGASPPNLGSRFGVLR
jgi:hypothetical protein